MILRRVIEHVRTQNWTAVVLDFFIVVVGVFIGIQVSNWNETRSDAIEAGNALDWLEEDFRQNLARTERSLAAHETNLAAAGRLIDGIRTGQFVEGSLTQDINRAANFATPPGPSATFQELVSGSRLRLIRSVDLRRKLYEYDDYVTFLRSQYGYFTEALRVTRDGMLRAHSLDVSGEPSMEIAGTWTTADVDRNRLKSDPEMLVLLQSAYGTQDNIHAVLLATRTRIVEILELIRAERIAGTGSG